MALPKKTVLAVILGMILAPSIALATGKFTADDYKRALWMTTRFYGGQRSGVGPNWLAIGMPDSLQKSFMRDNYQGKDVSGGWFDCGDHAMFGQTQYWAAYNLAKAYTAFPTGFDDLYNGVDYSDYKASGKWNDVSGGTPNGIPDLIDELVYEADYITKAVISKDVFITLKGNPDADHKRWVTAGMMSQLNQSLGGECVTGGEEKYEAPDWKFKGSLTPCSGYATRSIKADKDKAMASNAAAALAVMSRILTRLDIYPERASLYKTKAIEAFEHAASIDGTIGYGEFYKANPNQWDDYVSAAVEMYELTKDAKYMAAAKDNAGKVNKAHNWAFNYNNADDMAFYNLYHSGVDVSGLDVLKKYADYYKSKINSEGLSEVGDPGWGTLRYPLAGGFIMALANTATAGEAYEDAIYKQVDFALGANNAKIAFVVGFTSSLTEVSPKFPHHRGVFQRNDNPSDEDKAKMTIPEKNRSHGALVANLGFPSTGFKDNVIDYKYSEVCTDYNVGLVGALGYIVSKLAPVDTSKFGTGTGTISRRAVRPLGVVRSGRSFEFRAPAGQVLSEVKVLDASGREVWSTSRASSEVGWVAPKSGLYVVHAKAGSDRFSASAVMP